MNVEVHLCRGSDALYEMRGDGWHVREGQTWGTRFLLLDRVWYFSITGAHAIRSALAQQVDRIQVHPLRDPLAGSQLEVALPSLDLSHSRATEAEDVSKRFLSPRALR
jgi:hypothetical protein